MSSTWKNNIEITIFGESHGKAIGIVLGNLPAGIKIDMDEVAREMKRRAPGQNKILEHQEKKPIKLKWLVAYMKVLLLERHFVG